VAVGKPKPQLPVAVRAGEPRDLDAIVALSLACARSRKSWVGPDWASASLSTERRLWWYRLSDGQTWVAVAEAGPTRVGCVTLWTGPRDAQRAYLIGPLVDPEWWGEGIGSALHEETLSVLQKRGYRRAELAVEAGNRPGRDFLEHRGWKLRESLPARSAMAVLTYGRELARPVYPGKPG
jgi:GNAT superfamily N-acetyltransferase